MSFFGWLFGEKKRDEKGVDKTTGTAEELRRSFKDQIPVNEPLNTRTTPDIGPDPEHKPDSEEKLDLTLWGLGKFIEDTTHRRMELDLLKYYQEIVDAKKYIEQSLSGETRYFLQGLIGRATEETEKQFVDWYSKGSKSDHFQPFILTEVPADYVLTVFDTIINKMSNILGETKKITVEITELCWLRNAEYMIARIQNGELEQIQDELGIAKKETEEERKAKFYKAIGFEELAHRDE